jgi:outer membrane protein insertion porin family
VFDFKEAEGDKFLDVETTISWRHDSRDTAIFPSEGAIQTLYGKASVPGSDLKYYKLSYEHRRYWPLAQDVVVSLAGEAGYANAYGGTSELPFWENFFGGGPNSIRGYRARSVGPRDSQGDPLGGNATYAGSLELLFPPPFKQQTKTVRIAAFIDIGSVVNTDDTDIFDRDELRYSVGMGASWLSPLGALTISYAKPLKTDSQDEEEEFQFNLGTTF